MKTFKHINGEIAPSSLVLYRREIAEDGSQLAAFLRMLVSTYCLPINFAVKI